ncbi:zona pellucida sperm-binding protein 3-like isoform X2 [Malaclemys terrapin pileata]|uniref:zona pellucida sperm-binding protein 3-like isoform X2 n=1 Tax=Malaclemys terrapin pileata TaxID=2991368 RepID=UPI0023A818A0|nr:zona pellucida sperm-binding protein 3-like isoform X2 [Malaclemys terrapin pileata]
MSSLLTPLAPINSVLYECNKTSIHLAVKMDPLGNGLLLDPQLVHLGSCLYSIKDLQGFLHFQYHLKDCSFSRLTSGNMIEYFTDLVYRPSPGTGRRYATSFTERINCTDYEAGRLAPTYGSSVTGHLSASGVLKFTVTLMNVDFSAPSDSKVFFLGSQIHIEFSVQSSFHQPLQIFVDECTATPTPEFSKSPRNYSIIANHGCLVDGKVANSQFLPRQTPEAIQLSLEAFEFAGVDSDIYLHCQVLVWDPKVLMDPTRKACSFHRNTNRWELLDSPSLSSGCSCCDSLCQATTSRHKRDLEGSSKEGLVHAVVVGPLKVQKPSAKTGSYAWDSNRSLAAQSVTGGKPSVMPPPVGALLLEVALIAVVSLGFCLYNGHHKRLCSRTRGAADSCSEGLVTAEQQCTSINADVE